MPWAVASASTASSTAAARGGSSIGGPLLIHLDAATGSAVASRRAAVSTSRYNGPAGSAVAVGGRTTGPTSSDPANSRSALRLRVMDPSCLGCPGDSAEDL